MTQTNFRGDDELRVSIIAYVFEHFLASKFLKGRKIGRLALGAPPVVGEGSK